MPTPFQHLVYAERVLCAPALPAPVRGVLQGDLGSYLLGSTAGDVQVVSGQRRLETHFYRVSQGPEVPATEALLTAYPELADPYCLAPAHAAFVSGYLTHLVWDELWAWDIFVPFYRDNARWSDRLAYALNHNALRVWLDRTAEARLREAPSLVPVLCDVALGAWLPFVPRWALVQWRAWLVKQLEDPDAVETARVFADRMRVPVEVLERAVTAVAHDTEVSTPGMAAALAQYEARALQGSLEALLRYWRIPDRLGVAGARTASSLDR